MFAYSLAAGVRNHPVEHGRVEEYPNYDVGPEARAQDADRYRALLDEA